MPGMPGIVWPDVEAAFRTYMLAALAARPEPITDNVFVGNTLPAVRPQRAVIVRDDGGPVLGDVRAVARLGIRVWAAKAADAHDLAALVAALVTLWPDGKPVVRATTSRAYPLPDESGQASRYFTAEVVVRGVNL
jgi:hypothetical protein